MSIPRPVVWSLALMSFLPLAGAAVAAAHIGSFVASAERSRGRVVELRPVGDDDGRTTFKPVVRFTAADGQERTFTSTFATYPPAYDLGEQVDVLYPKGAPEAARLDGWVSLWLWPLIAAGFGGVCALVGLGLYLALRLEARKRA